MAVAALVAVAAAPASAAAPPSWSQKADEIAAPWPGLQQSDGSFRDYVLVRDPSDMRDDYGDPMMGYALLLTAARTGDTTLADSGLRALEFSLARAARSPSTQVFHQLAVVSAYNLARERFAGHPVFGRARSRWEDVLRRVAVYRLGRQKVTNKSIVESILLQELLRSGLSSNERGSALAERDATLAAVRRFLSSELPKAARPYQVAGRTVFGDMPLLPPAYHALSVGMLARALGFATADGSTEADRLLRRGVLASAAAAGPDGDVAYHGRSQSQAWTLPLTALGAAHTGQDGLAALAVDRLGDYPTGPEGLLVTPSLAQDIEDALPGVDEYMAGASYTGLTLMALEWAIEAGSSDGPSRTPGHVLGAGPGSWATSQKGDVWFAVKRTRSSTRDLRYDFGLVSVKDFGGGAWRDLLPPRPRTIRASDSAGPVLRRGGSVGFPEGSELRLGKGGRIIVRGGFRDRAGRWLRRGVTFTFAPAGCGVRLAFGARAGDVLEFSGFFRDKPRRSGFSVADQTQRIRFDQRPNGVTYEGEYASGSDVGLTRARARLRRSRSGTVAIEVCRP